jgi:hypothetical protein
MYSMCTPRGEMKTRPTLAPSFMTEPWKYLIQVSCSIFAGGVCISVHSATKSASTWDLIALREAYVIFCPINSSAHLAILPSASGFWMISPSGYLDTTVMGCASK